MVGRCRKYGRMSAPIASLDPLLRVGQRTFVRRGGSWEEEDDAFRGRILIKASNKGRVGLERDTVVKYVESTKLEKSWAVAPACH